MDYVAQYNIYRLGETLFVQALSRYAKVDYGDHMPKADSAKFYLWRLEYYRWIEHSGGPLISRIASVSPLRLP